jgi:predicted methyltransferase
MMRPASLLVLLAACASAPTTAPATPPSPTPLPAEDAIATAVAAPDRTDEDKKNDATRKPEAFLRFTGIAPGMRVADLGAGGGYLTELFVRVVGDGGQVYGQNAPLILEKFAKDAWAARVARPINAKVVPLVTEMGAPLPPEARDLDLVVIGFFYHDTIWMEVDRKAMNASVFAALVPGGAYVIADHSGRDGTGTSEVQTLHRIEKKVVIDEVTAAGFVLEAESDRYANPADTRDWNVFGEGRGTTDRFVLRFRKPRP